MVEAFRCSQCSAPVTDDNWTSCPFCGIVLNKPTINPLRAATAPARFAAARRHPDLERLLQLTPSTSGFAASQIFLVFFLVIWIGATLFMSTVFAEVAGLAALLPLAMGVFGFVMVSRGLVKARSIRNAPLEREIVVLLDERTEVSGGGKDSSASTAYYLLVQGEDGARTELGCSAQVAGKVTAGDIGVAYRKGSWLADFQRIDV